MAKRAILEFWQGPEYASVSDWKDSNSKMSFWQDPYSLFYDVLLRYIWEGHPYRPHALWVGDYWDQYSNKKMYLEYIVESLANMSYCQPKTSTSLKTNDGVLEAGVIPMYSKQL